MGLDGLATEEAAASQTALVVLAYRAVADPFGKIRGEEIGESTASKQDKDGKLETVNARLSKAEGSTATLTE